MKSNLKQLSTTKQLSTVKNTCITTSNDTSVTMMREMMIIILVLWSDMTPARVNAMSAIIKQIHNCIQSALMPTSLISATPSYICVPIPISRINKNDYHQHSKQLKYCILCRRHSYRKCGFHEFWKSGSLWISSNGTSIQKNTSSKSSALCSSSLSSSTQKIASFISAISAF